ncbi:MAG: endonuclease domain-containing protein [Geobacter sp.]
MQMMVITPLPLWEGAGGGLNRQIMPINLTQTARELRKRSTDAEQALWKHLKGRQFCGMKFRRQEQIGRFIADFVCYEKRLIIEADGGQHAVEKEKDLERTAWLASQGFAVLRFWNNDVLKNIDGVLEELRRQCCEIPSPGLRPPSPAEGRGDTK